MYGALAEWWPLISPPGEYADEAALFAAVLGSAARPVRNVLELCSGGGSNAAHLKARFALTLVDLSADMLEVSRRLNPECVHHVGDMRTVRLARSFDAVFVHDAIDYLTTEDDLRRTVETAWQHCRPGGLPLLVPDDIVETFEPSTDHGGSDAPDGRGARYLSWSWDPDPHDTQTTTAYAILLRDADGSVRAVHETHHTGLFARGVWPRTLGEAGFAPEAIREQTDEDRVPRTLFIGRRPWADASRPARATLRES